MLFFTSCKKQGQAGKSVFEPTIQGINLTMDAGVDIAQNSGTANLDATSSSASNKTFSWSKVSGPGAVVFGNSSSEDTTATVSVEGEYVLSITVTAGSGDTASDTVSFLYDATAPIVDAGTAATLKNSAYTQNATVTDTNSVSYLWSVDSGPGSVVAANVEDPSLSVTADGSYTIRLTATDVAGNSAFDTFTLDWDATSPSVNAGADNIVSTVTFQDATVTDANPLTYSWTKVSGPGIVTFGTPAAEDTNISADTDGDYIIRLQGTDSFGNSSTDTINWRWDTTIPTVNEVKLTNIDASYGIGSSINVQVIFSEPVTVAAGTPQLTLDMDVTDRTANYMTGSGSDTLNFSYTIVAGDDAADLDYVGTGSLVLNGATIQDAIGNNANLTLATPGAVNSISDDQAVVVDTTSPVLTEVTTSKADGTYGVSENIAIEVIYNETVNIIGTPQLTLETGGVDRVVNYSTGSGTQTLVFNYSVGSGDSSSDLDYQSASALNLNGGSIRDSANNNAGIALATPGLANSISDDKAIVIDTVQPFVSEVKTPLGNGTYGVGTTVPIEVVFSEVVIVGGTPQITLETGVTDAVVNYSSGSGTDTLTFDYSISNGEMNSDLDYLNTGALSLNGGSIDDGVNPALLTLSIPGLSGSISDDQNIDVDTSGPSVTQVRSSKADGNYAISENIDILVEWSEVVNVSGTPQITLETGAADSVVSYSAGTGTQTLTFTYTVTAGDISSDLDYVATNSLSTNGGSIRNGALQDAFLTLAAPGALNSISDNQAIAIDGVVPTVTQVRSSKANGYYNSGEVIDVLVEFSENVDVLGLPQITLETGATDAIVNYSSGSGTDTLTFQYTVGATDSNLDLDYETTGSLNTGGGSIRDSFGNDANILLVAPGGVGSISDNQAIVIDNTIPNVSSVEATNTDGGYTIGAPLSIKVIFDEAVTVSGTPEITLEMGATDKAATYSAGAGTDTLTFSYTVASGDTTGDLDYNSTFALVTAGGAIDDLAGNAANLNLASPGSPNSISDDQAIVIDTTIPTLNSVLTLKTDGAYGVGEEIDIVIQFSEVIEVSGFPQIELETGTIDEAVSYSSGSGSSLLTFRYTVKTGNISSDLDYKSTTSLSLNGGTLKDVGGNDVVTTLPSPGALNSISDDKDIVIDGSTPNIIEVKSSKVDGGYGTSEEIDILVVFNEAVFVTGTPQITLETGVTDRVVNYISGSASDTLVFRYTVQSGDINLDLDYSSTSSLVLNGGLIGDAVPNPADLSLPTPGFPGSISDDQQIIVDTILPIVNAGSDRSASSSFTQDAVITEDSTPLYSWVKVSGPGVVNFSPSSSVQDPNISVSVNGAYVIRLDVTDSAGNLSSDTFNLNWDNIPPPATDSFTAATTSGIDNGTIDITIDFPVDVSDYNLVQIRGAEGVTPPSGCSNGFLVKSYTVGQFIDETYEADTSYPGGQFSGRLCIWDSFGNLTSSQTFNSIIASKVHKVFVTNDTYGADLNSNFNSETFANSQEGADYRCQYQADLAGISTSSDKWISVLSTTNYTAFNKVAINGQGHNMSGETLFSNKFDFWDGILTNAIKFDEFDVSVGAQQTWTGTTTGGALAANHCTDFTSTSFLQNGNTGLADQSGNSWVSQGNSACSGNRSLICISQINIEKFTSLSITTGTSPREIDLSINLPMDNDVTRFYDKIEVYRKTGPGEPTFNCDGSDGSLKAQTFNGPFTQGQSIQYTDNTPGAPGTSYNYTICTFDKDLNPVNRDPVLNVSSGL
ncbi:MAG: hypothetical protein CME70_01110 [Halobacteriovorax sp.]|nr:hypothetical protein [Halobacteriovorax sp.]